jgi:NitT/TauT family transport system substrate-binding protein
MGGDMIGDFLAVENNIPTIAVAAHFQKNPQIFMSHPGVGLDKWQDVPAANPAFVSSGAVNTFWAWMRLAYGFKDDNIKPYNFNSAPRAHLQNFVDACNSPGGSKPSGASPHTNSLAKPGLQSHTDSKSARSSKCRD